MDSTKKKIIKSKVKKPKVKKSKVKKPKTTQKQKQKQKQTQTTRVTVNIGKTTTTRRKQPAGRRPMLSSLPSPYVHPPIIIQGNQQQPNITLLDLDRREEKLKSGIKEGFKTLSRRIDESVGNLAMQENAPLETVKNEFEKNEERDREQQEGTAEQRSDPFTSSSVSDPPLPEPVVGRVIKKIPKTQIGEKVQAKINKYIETHNREPDRKTVLNYASNNDFQSMGITRDDIRDYIEESGQFPKQKGGRRKKKN